MPRYAGIHTFIVTGEPHREAAYRGEPFVKPHVVEYLGVLIALFEEDPREEHEVPSDIVKRHKVSFLYYRRLRDLAYVESLGARAATRAEARIAGSFYLFIGGIQEAERIASHSVPPATPRGESYVFEVKFLAASGTPYEGGFFLLLCERVSPPTRPIYELCALLLRFDPLYELLRGFRWKLVGGGADLVLVSYFSRHRAPHKNELKSIYPAELSASFFSGAFSSGIGKP